MIVQKNYILHYHQHFNLMKVTFTDLKKNEEIEAFLQNDILERERLYKKFKRYNIR